MKKVYCTRRKKESTCDAVQCVWDQGTCKYIQDQAPKHAAHAHSGTSWEVVKNACYTRRAKQVLAPVFKKLVKRGELKRMPPRNATVEAQCTMLTDALFAHYDAAKPSACATRKTTKKQLTDISKRLNVKLRSGIKKEDMCDVLQKAVWDSVMLSSKPINPNASSAPILASTTDPTQKMQKEKVLASVSKAYSQKAVDRVEYANQIQRVLSKKPSQCAIVSSHAYSPSVFKRISRIGSNSAHGEVHLVEHKGKHATLYAALKVMPAKRGHDQDFVSRSEIAHYLDLNSMTLEAKSPHFPLVYSVDQCLRCHYENEKIDARKAPHCFILFAELAAGDLKTWLTGNATRSNEELLSLQAQMLMGLAALQAKMRIHNDLHWGNWLYREVPVGGYWKYVIQHRDKGSMDVYIKNAGQQWILWDFGMMEEADAQRDAVPSISQGFAIDILRSTNVATWLKDEFPNNTQSPFFFKTFKELHSESQSYHSKSYMQFKLKNYAFDLLAQQTKRLGDTLLINPATPPVHIINRKPFILDAVVY